MHDAAAGVGQHLRLDVAHIGHGLFQKHRAVAEGAVGFPASGLDCLGQVLGALHAAHAAPAAA